MISVVGVGGQIAFRCEHGELTEVAVLSAADSSRMAAAIAALPEPIPAAWLASMWLSLNIVPELAEGWSVVRQRLH